MIEQKYGSLVEVLQPVKVSVNELFIFLKLSGLNKGT